MEALRADRPHGITAGHLAVHRQRLIRIAGIVVVAFGEDGVMLDVLAAGEAFPEGFALQLRGDGRPHSLQQRRRHVNVLRQLLDHIAAPNHARQLHQQGDLHAAVVQRGLGAVGCNAVIGGEDHQRAGLEPKPVNSVHQPLEVRVQMTYRPLELAQRLSHLRHIRDVGRDVDVLGCVGGVDVAAVPGEGALPARRVHLDRADVHVKRRRVGRSALQVANGLIDGVLAVMVLEAGVALDLVAVVRGAMTLVLEAEMGRLVARVVEVVHNRLRLQRHAPAAIDQAHQPVRVGVLPAHAAAAGGAAGCGIAEVADELHAFIGESLEIRARHFRAVAAQVLSQVVADYIEDVGPGPISGHWSFLSRCS